MFTIRLQKLAILLAISLAGCGQANQSIEQQAKQNPQPAQKDQQPIVDVKVWGETNGKQINLYTIKNKNGMSVSVSNWGAYVQSLIVPDKNGRLEDVILGYDTWPEYYNDCCYSGPIVGRFGNRIAKGQFTIDDTTYNVTRNNGGPNKDINHLHGGAKGLHKRVWSGKLDGNKVVLNYLSVDGEEGYPGNLNIQVTYSLNNNNEFRIDYLATTDKKTPVNLTWHAYFNLSGNNKENIENHLLAINANKITPIDKLLIPTGELASVDGTPFDFRQAQPIAKNIRTANQQLKFGGGLDKQYGGYDHNWVFSQYDGTLKNQASLYEPISGRYMEILTKEPALQFYSGNFMSGEVIGKNGKAIEFRNGLALEPQNYPDAPNHPYFPDSILTPKETYQSTSIYRFSIKSKVTTTGQ
ncbi:aldose epimerase family protein [Catenovulum adriaticum]|uniref:Aldose 1-epimerase n=1 Tax=Catenovulum adriaticum TaxID=2984846 RepID=A0ABY7AT37_9ALTE|nr:aldose epimerase family protein [Catenovulum sp. TS8]WAJ71836.1 galactose mutarotase [Catenovulum sp. TS8]